MNLPTPWVYECTHHNGTIFYAKKPVTDFRTATCTGLYTPSQVMAMVRKALAEKAKEK
jgi:hypothetical protein